MNTGPGLCTICHRWQHTGIVHLSLQADGKVAFEDVPVFGVCCPACHDSSLYLFVLVLFLETVVLSKVHVALDIFYQHIVHVCWGVVYNHPGLCSNAFAFASANANAAFALALAFDCPAADAFALAFAFDSSAFALALAFDSNAFDWNQMRNKCESNAKQMRIK